MTSRSLVDRQQKATWTREPGYRQLECREPGSLRCQNIAPAHIMGRGRRNPMSEQTWPRPQRRHVPAFSDLTFFADALDQAQDSRGVTAARLQENLAPRIRSLRRLQCPGPSTICGILEELELYGWLSPGA